MLGAEEVSEGVGVGEAALHGDAGRGEIGLEQKMLDQAEAFVADDLADRQALKLAEPEVGEAAGRAELLDDVVDGDARGRVRGCRQARGARDPPPGPANGSRHAP